ncbi:MAG: alpha/beta hydrolase [Microbacteriaceae bacterium]|jgi:pimeloyl-ACP methyl ester carboxylesterase|nr:alpha/beta hydrolase [Microbacteriaceae bacterium]
MNRIEGYATNPDDGARTFYQCFGAHGSPVVLIHGSALSGASWRGLGYVRALQSEHRVLIYDLRGHGRSSKPHDLEAYEPELFTGDLLAAMDAVGFEAAHLMGYSFGARLALHLAVHRSPRLLSFVELAGSPAAARGEVYSVFYEGFTDVLRRGDIDAFISGWEAHLGVPLDAGTRQALRGNDPLALAAYFDGISRKGDTPDDELRRIEAPSLWIAGTEDHPRFESSQRVAALLGVQFVPLPGRTHASTMFPAGPVLDVVRPFFDSVDARR